MILAADFAVNVQTLERQALLRMLISQNNWSREFAEAELIKHHGFTR